MHKDNNMPRKWLKTFEMRAKQKKYKQNIKIANDNINVILKSDYNPIIEYSGGKDSLVLLDLIMKYDKSIPVYNYHPGYGKYSKQIYRTQETHKEVMKSAYQTGVENITVVNTPFSRKNYLIGDYFDLLFKLMKDLGCDLELLGIRGDESITRKHRVKGSLIRKENHRLVSFPIRHLTWQDIWTYIVTNDLFYVSHYDKYGKIYGYDKVRFTSHFNKNELHLGGSYLFDKIIDPYNANEVAKPNDYWDKGR